MDGKMILKSASGKVRVDRHKARTTTGQSALVEDIFDDEGFYTSRLLSVGNSRTGAYHAERVVNPASKMHKGTQSTKVDAMYSPRLGKYATQRKMNSTGHLKDL